MYLEYSYKTYGDQGRKIRIQGQCNYLVRETHKDYSKWKKKSNCRVISQINLMLTFAGTMPDDSCLEGYLMKSMCYLISNRRLRIVLANIAIVVMNEQYFTGLVLASYLNKLPQHVKLMGVLVSRFHDKTQILQS